MQRYILTLIVLFLILLASCGPKEGGSGLNTKVHYASVPQVDFSPTTISRKYFDYYSANVLIGAGVDTLRFCHCSRQSDKIKIMIYGWSGLTSSQLTIDVADSSFISRFEHTSDVKDLDETVSAIEQELTLNKLGPTAGDTVSGHINFTGLSISGYSQKAVNKIKMQGSFSCVVKNE